jgi:hypothetical protein
MTRLGRDVVDWLVAALDPMPRRPVLGVPTGLAAAAVAHGVPVWAARHADRLALDVPDLRAAAHASTARHLRAGTDLRTCAAALDAAGVDFLAVKGAAVVRTCHGGDPVRSYVDVDLAVRPSDLRHAVSALRDSGCTLVDANWPLLRADRVRELRLLGPAGAPVDLHWSLGYEPGPHDLGPSVDTLLARSRRVDAGGADVRTLDGADTLVHLALHAAHSGGNRLVWLADLRGALDALPAGAPLGQRVEEWRAAPGLRLMLARLARVLGHGHPPPYGWTGSASAAAWDLLRLGIDGVWPPERRPDGRSPGRLLARAAAPSPSASLGRVLAHAARGVRPPGNGPAWVSMLFDSSNPRSPLHPVGGTAAEARFFDDVAAGADLREGLD